VTVGGGWRKWAAQATGQQIADGWTTSRRRGRNVPAHARMLAHEGEFGQLGRINSMPGWTVTVGRPNTETVKFSN
jgi:hypothetical protein